MCNCNPILPHACQPPAPPAPIPAPPMQRLPPATPPAAQDNDAHARLAPAPLPVEEDVRVCHACPKCSRLCERLHRARTLQWTSRTCSHGASWDTTRTPPAWTEAHTWMHRTAQQRAIDLEVARRREARRA